MPIDAPQQALDHCTRVVRPALLLAPRNYLSDVAERLAEADIQNAVARHDTGAIYDWMVRLLARQGIGNHAAEMFLARHGSPTHADIGDLLSSHARCPRLRSYWAFAGCGYRRTTGTCGSPHHQIGCPVTVLPSRKGSLAEAAIGLWLFVRDIMDGDIVGWLDDRLVGVEMVLGDDRRAASMRASVLEPLIETPGTGPKIWSMILAELLLGADPKRERWVTTGASFVAVDTLLHAYFRRTGVLRRLGAEHPYGPGCYTTGGCVDVIAGLSRRIDAREFNPEFPAVFPRWVQFAVWQYCAEGGLAICNGSKIDDREPCDQRFCPAYQSCDHMGLRLPAGSTAAIFECRSSMTRF